MFLKSEGATTRKLFDVSTVRRSSSGSTQMVDLNLTHTESVLVLYLLYKRMTYCGNSSKVEKSLTSSSKVLAPYEF